MSRERTPIERIILRPSVALDHPARPLPPTAIAVGQLYKKNDGRRSIWEVVSIFQDGGGVRHARLRGLDDPTEVKLIAEAALHNPKYYQHIASEPAPVFAQSE